MAQLYGKSCDHMELLDLLLDQPIAIAQAHNSCHGSPHWPITGHQQPLTSEGGAEDFLGSLLDECPSPSSPQWPPLSPSDSGISDDAQSPPPSTLASPLLDQLYFPSIQAPPPNPIDPLHQHSHLPQPHNQQPEEITEADFSIDFGGLDPVLFFSYPVQVQHMNSGIPLTVKDLLLSGTNQQSKPPSPSSQLHVLLNEDEKKLLVKEGISLPNQLPLTKSEENILKKIRRKIRNKQSAQESRKKKKEYIDGLEARMAACSTQNQELQKKVCQLEKTNTSLLEQLRRLQSLVMSSSNKPAQTGTCILVLLLSFSLLLFPSLKPLSHSRAPNNADIGTARVHSRSLRSVMEVPAFSSRLPLQADVGTESLLLTKLQLRSGYADSDLGTNHAHNHSSLNPHIHTEEDEHSLSHTNALHPDQLLSHDPIIGRSADTGHYAWMTHPDAALLRRRDDR